MEFLKDRVYDYYFGDDAVNIINDMKSLKPGLRQQMFEKYLKFIIPALAALQVDGEIHNRVEGAVKID